MAIIHADANNFNENIAKGVVLVDFYADWCGPCKMIAPVLEQVSTELTDVKIVKLNVDEARDIALQYGVMSIPNLILFKNGVQTAQTLGYKTKDQLLSWINGNK